MYRQFSRILFRCKKIIANLKNHQLFVEFFKGLKFRELLAQQELVEVLDWDSLQVFLVILELVCLLRHCMEQQLLHPK